MFYLMLPGDREVKRASVMRAVAVVVVVVKVVWGSMTALNT